MKGLMRVGASRSLADSSGTLGLRKRRCAERNHLTSFPFVVRECTLYPRCDMFRRDWSVKLDGRQVGTNSNSKGVPKHSLYLVLLAPPFLTL